MCEERKIKTYLKDHNNIIEDVGKIETNWRKSCLVPARVLFLFCLIGWWLTMQDSRVIIIIEIMLQSTVVKLADINAWGGKFFLV